MSADLFALGEGLLDQQVLDRVSAELQSQRSSALGDSPIERLLYRAMLLCGHVIGASECRQVLVVQSEADLSVMLRHEQTQDLVVMPQAWAAGWRVDFLVHAWDFGSATGKPQWRRLIVECDGHDFHERTKDQAARDRSRDRKAQMLGFGILRFTGSEIHRDPLGCAMQVHAWAAKGWF